MRNLRHFLLMVIIPLLLAAVGVSALTIDLVSRLSTGANIEDHRRTAEVVNAAILATQNELSNAVSDNANWDDGAIQVYKPEIDHEYVNLTWGETSAMGVLYDLIFVVTSDGKLLSGFIGGEQVDLDPHGFLGGRLMSLLSALPQNATEAKSAAAVVETPRGIVAFSVGNFVPTSSDTVLDSPGPRYLVLGRFLDAGFLAELGNRYVVDKLALTPARSEGFVALENSFGDYMGTLTWQDRRPGDLTRAAIILPATAMLALLAAVMTAIALICWQQFQLIAKRERQAQYDASHDALTGLPNRVALIRGTSAALSNAGNTVAVLFIDLDGFKDVNDTYDHATGDALIRAVAAGFAVLLPEGAQLGRIGGDEFLILITGPTAEAEAVSAAGCILEFLAQPFDLEGRIAMVGASIGMAHAIGGTVEAGELMRRADVAMYDAKARHKNRLEIYTPAMDGERNGQTVILDELRGFIDNGLIEVAYQPIIDAATLKICAVEALARWPKAAARHVGPDKFIAIAESSGLINRLGMQILDKACSDAASWGDLRVAINISPIQLRDPEFAARVLEVVSSHGINPSRIEFEVTEGTLIEQPDRIAPIFEKLQRAGFSIALDDFGSGYSSIAYLRQLPFNRIKIDRSITSELLISESARSMIQATGLIAHGLHAQVTAEGVEAEEEIQMLRLAGCSELQGYFFGKPQSSAAVTSMIEAAAAPEREALNG